MWIFSFINIVDNSSPCTCLLTKPGKIILLFTKSLLEICQNATVGKILDKLKKTLIKWNEITCSIIMVFWLKWNRECFSFCKIIELQNQWKQMSSL